MFVQSNLLSDIPNYFHRKLKGKYSVEEIDIFFNWICEDVFSVKRTSSSFQNKRLTESELLLFKDAVDRLLQNEPIQYIIGQAAFYGLKFKVDSNVLIPRPETEELVDWVIKDNKVSSKLRIVDVGTGSGCIAITLRKEIPTAEVYAIDVEENALNVAKENAKLLNCTINFMQNDILHDDLNISDLDIIVSNPPYILLKEKSEMAETVLNHEPHLALFVDDKNALVFYQAIIEKASKILKPNGLIYFEINARMVDKFESLSNQFGFALVEKRKDINDNFRFVKLMKK